MDYILIKKQRIKELESAIAVCLVNNKNGSSILGFYDQVNNTDNLDRKKELNNIIGAYIGSSIGARTALEYYKEIIEIKKELKDMETVKCVK